MDVGKNDAKICNGNKTSSVAVSKDETDKGEEEDGETSSLLLPSLKKGGMKGRRQSSRSKKVQWNDRNGDKLVEVLEFQPRCGEIWFNGFHICRWGQNGHSPQRITAFFLQYGRCLLFIFVPRN